MEHFPNRSDLFQISMWGKRPLLQNVWKVAAHSKKQNEKRNSDWTELTSHTKRTNHMLYCQFSQLATSRDSFFICEMSNTTKNSLFFLAETIVNSSQSASSSSVVFKGHFQQSLSAFDTARRTLIGSFILRPTKNYSDCSFFKMGFHREKVFPFFPSLNVSSSNLCSPTAWTHGRFASALKHIL